MDNSPAIHRLGIEGRIAVVRPGGTIEHVAQCLAVRHPSGTQGIPVAGRPSSELLGYCRSSRRDGEKISDVPYAVPHHFRRPQHLLYFAPLPQGHAPLRRIFAAFVVDFFPQPFGELPCAFGYSS